MSNGVPKFLCRKNLEERGIAKTNQAVRHIQIHHGFPLGRLLGPGMRVWTEDEINEWLASRPVEISERARRRAKASIEARRANGKLHTARQMLHGAA
jgi:hypothetical protein